MEFWRTFIMILVMSAFLSNKSFVTKLYDLLLDIKDLYVPFLIDSDITYNIQDELKNFTAIRRYYCINCEK